MVPGFGRPPQASPCPTARHDRGTKSHYRPTQADALGAEVREGHPRARSRTGRGGGGSPGASRTSRNRQPGGFDRRNRVGAKRRQPTSTPTPAAPTARRTGSDHHGAGAGGRGVRALRQAGRQDRGRGERAGGFDPGQSDRAPASAGARSGGQRQGGQGISVVFRPAQGGRHLGVRSGKVPSSPGRTAARISGALSER